MNNLIQASFMRLKSSKAFYASLLAALLYSAQQAFSSRSSVAVDGVRRLSTDAILFIPFSALLITSAIFVSLFIGEEYNSGTIRNKVIVGHKRSDIYLSSFVVCSIGNLLTAIIAMCTGFIIASARKGVFFCTLPIIAFYILCGLFIVVSMTAILVLVAMNIKKQAVSSIVCILLGLAMLVVGIKMVDKLERPQIYEDFSNVPRELLMNPDKERKDYEEYIVYKENPEYIGGTPRKVLEVMANSFPGGQSVQMINVLSTNYRSYNCDYYKYEWIVYSTLCTMLASGIGIILFRQKSLT